MKRFGLAVGLAAMMALAVPSLASANGDYGKNRDWVVGSIKRLSLDLTRDQHFTIAAWETRTGADGIYIAKYREANGTTYSYTGRVTCINVVGQNAMVGIKLVKTTFPGTVVGQGGTVAITNYGGPNVVGQRDSISPGDFLAAAPTVCPPIRVAITPTYAGNVIVHDGDL